MKFNINLDELQFILKCLRASVKISSFDIDGRLVITANEDNSVNFITNNGVVSTAIKSNSSSVNTPGSVAVIYNKLQSFVFPFSPWTEEKGGSKTAVFRLNDKSLSVSVDNLYKDNKIFKSNIRLDTFGVLTSDSEVVFNEPLFTFNSSVLKVALDKIMYTIDPNSNVRFLRGANLKFIDNNIYFAGTNGLIISEYAIKNESSLDKKSFILTYEFIRGLRTVLSNLPKEEFPVLFNVTDNVIKVKLEDVIYSGRLLVNCEFPEYRVELLKTFKHKIICSKDMLLNNLNPIIGILDSDDDNRLTININKNTIKFFNDTAESTFTIEDEIDGNVIFDLDGKMFKDAINNTNDDMVIIKFEDENSGVIMDSNTFEDQKTRVLSMRRRKTS